MTTAEFMRLLPLLVPLIAIQLVLLAAALIDLIRRPRTRGPMWAWGLVIDFISIFGPLAYFLFGRAGPCNTTSADRQAHEEGWKKSRSADP